MIRCTAGGKGSSSKGKDVVSFGLPRDEMNSFKRTMFGLFPEYQSCPEQFEPVWKDCVTTLGDACRRFHKSKLKKGSP